MATKKQSDRYGNDDTIVAIITSPGQGGIAALRIAGPKSLKFLNQHFHPQRKSDCKPFLMRYGQFVSSEDEIIDEVLAVYMPEGQSYTGIDQVELYCHGGLQMVRTILEILIKSGARGAEPGEFTKLAFLNGRIDLTMAEAVAEVIAAKTETSFVAGREHLLGAYSEHVNSLREKLVSVLSEIEASIDFSEESDTPDRQTEIASTLKSVTSEIKKLVDSYSGGRIINEGFKIAIAGRPNAGKSSLFNLLLKQERALVHQTAGTTRDYLSEWIDLEGFAVNLVDTAGLRSKSAALEKLGQDKSRQVVDSADLLIWMFDISGKSWYKRLNDDLKELKHRNILLLGNKIDLVDRTGLAAFETDKNTSYVSCLTRKGIKDLRTRIVENIKANVPDLSEGLVVTSARHKQKLTGAQKILKRIEKMIESGESAELLAFELREAIAAIDEITGKVYNEQILEQIFSKFCIGK